MVQTRGQPTGDQSPSSCAALRGVIAEGDAASTAVTSGATLKHAVSVPSTEHSAAVLAGGGSGRDETVSRPSRSIQCTATQKPYQSTNYLRGSEQRSCYHELLFTGRCAQPVQSACSNSRWDSAGRASNTVPSAAAHVRSAPAASVDKSGTETAL